MNSDDEDDSKSGKGTRLRQRVSEAALSTFYALTGAEPYYDPLSDASYSTILHTRPWLFYQGTSTTVPVTVLGRRVLPEDRRFYLQRRGWRTGLLGWTIGAWLGGTIGKEMDVTPERYGTWEKDVEPARREQYDKEIRKFLDSGVLPKDHKALETDFLHIPVASGDGYFRLLVYHPSASMVSPIAATATFRVGSLSLSSAHSRGASIVTIIPEFSLEVAWFVATTVAWTSFYSAFPFLKTAQLVPFTRTWSTWALRLAYKLTGGKRLAGYLKEKYRVEERKVQAEETVSRVIPFGSVGVRTAYDLEEDARKGRGGVAFKRMPA
ncbi:hypothetical protein LshimejAT787_0308680 [Lyophyllum shimeji]|uniref:Uncharacterized protein n=1 Tax=Lyophyllum shimeji TaxID=47721 RepID=A0A9P3UMB5_LYOSH|nr:hypothetical protein LshimejAT787_0308680 [Lyophyllum shimeji]